MVETSESFLIEVDYKIGLLKKKQALFQLQILAILHITFLYKGNSTLHGIFNRISKCTSSVKTFLYYKITTQNFPFFSFLNLALSFSQFHDQAEFLSFLSRTFKQNVDVRFVLSMVLQCKELCFNCCPQFMVLVFMHLLYRFWNILYCILVTVTPSK